MAAVTLTTVAIGAAIGAGVGAVATYAAGGRGDALWKGALVGAVSGAVTAGVGSWAGGGIAGGAVGGLAGGVTAGALGTALSGGNRNDYLKNILTGGATGAALGAAGGYLSGGEAAAGTPSGTEAATVETGSGLTTGTASVDTGGAMGLGSGTGATGVEASVSGTPATPTPVATTTPLADTVSSLDTGGAMAGGGSTVAPSPVTTPTTSGTTPSLGETAFTYDDYPSQTMIDKGTANPMGTQELANSPSFKMKELGADLGMDTFGYGKTLGQTTSKGTGMGLEDYLKMQGKAQLLGGGIKALGALATAPETQQNKQQLMDLYNQQQDQNEYYANLMRGTYENPQGYLGSPEAAATRSAALQKILAANAAAGRRTVGSAAYNQLMMNQLQNLNAYRQGMPRPSYGTAYQTLAGAQQYSPTADIFGGVSSAITPLSLYSLYPA